MFWGKYEDPDNANALVQGLFRYSSVVGIERLVDSTMIMPGKAEPLEDITEFSTNQGNVAFLGGRYSDASFEGVYNAINRNLQVVADSATLLPGTSGSSSLFYHPIIEGDQIAFVAGQGIFQSKNGVLAPLVLGSELIPGRTDSFHGFGNIAFDNGV